MYEEDKRLSNRVFGIHNETNRNIAKIKEDQENKNR